MLMLLVGNNVFRIKPTTTWSVCDVQRVLYRVILHLEDRYFRSFTKKLMKYNTLLKIKSFPTFLA